MAALAYLMIFLSLLALGAHFLREGAMPLVACTICLTGLLLVRRRWAARVLQSALVLGSLEWLYTLAVLALQRIQVGLPYGRMTIILATVAGISLLSALSFQSRWLAPRYGLRVRGTANERSIGTHPGPRA